MPSTGEVTVTRPALGLATTFCPTGPFGSMRIKALGVNGALAALSGVYALFVTNFASIVIWLFGSITLISNEVLKSES